MRRVTTALFGSMVLLVAAAFAADDKPKDRGVVRDTEPKSNVTFIARGSTVAGMTVKNEQDEELGTINDVMIDLGTGQIRYAALSFGGVLGIGNKLFAVPWHALKYRHASDKSRHFVLDVDKERLKVAPGFDKNNWPDFGNPKWSISVDEFYGAPRTALKSE